MSLDRGQLALGPVMGREVVPVPKHALAGALVVHRLGPKFPSLRGVRVLQRHIRPPPLPVGALLPVDALLADPHELEPEGPFIPASHQRTWEPFRTHTFGIAMNRKRVYPHPAPLPKKNKNRRVRIRIAESNRASQSLEAEQRRRSSRRVSRARCLFLGSSHPTRRGLQGSIGLARLSSGISRHSVRGQKHRGHQTCICARTRKQNLPDVGNLPFVQYQDQKHICLTGSSQSPMPSVSVSNQVNTQQPLHFGN